MQRDSQSLVPVEVRLLLFKAKLHINCFFPKKRSCLRDQWVWIQFLQTKFLKTIDSSETSCMYQKDFVVVRCSCLKIEVARCPSHSCLPCSCTTESSFLFQSIYSQGKLNELWRCSRDFFVNAFFFRVFVFPKQNGERSQRQDEFTCAFMTFKFTSRQTITVVKNSKQHCSELKGKLQRSLHNFIPEPVK